MDGPNAFYLAHIVGRVKPYERAALLERAERESATVGAAIPERLSVRGEELELRAEVMALQREDALTEAAAEHLRTLTRALRRERTERVNRLETEPMDRAEGEAVVETIIGIDRALEALTSVDEEVNIEAEIQQREVADMARWRSFLNEAKGGIDRGRDR